MRLLKSGMLGKKIPECMEFTFFIYTLTAASVNLEDKQHGLLFLPLNYAFAFRIRILSVYAKDCLRNGIF